MFYIEVLYTNVNTVHLWIKYSLVRLGFLCGLRKMHKEFMLHMANYQTTEYISNYNYDHFYVL